MNIRGTCSVLSLAFMTLLLLSACGGGGGDGSNVGGSSAGGGSAGGGTGSVNVLLTDAPACGYDHVFVTVDRIEISPSGSAWTTLPVDASVPQPIDLLDLTNGVLLALGQITLPAGTYEQVRLVLKANNGSVAPFANSIVLTGSSTPRALKTPSAQQSGYKILGPITVQAGTLTDLVLDFNACKSIVVAGASGKYLLKPVVTATAKVVSGTISGFALAGSQVSAYAESAGTLITGTVVPAGSPSAQFNLGPIQQTGAIHGSSVDVVIVPPATSGQGTVVIQGIPVKAGTTTWISPADGTFPFNATTATASVINTVKGMVTVAGSPGTAKVIASQTVTVSARTYEITSTISAPVTGTYSLSLAVLGPWTGTYGGVVTTIPIPLTENTAPTDASIYSIVASDALETSPPQSADVSVGSVTNLDFVLTQ